MFDKGEFGARVQLAEVYLIHEGADEKDAATGSAQDVLRSERIGNGVWVKPRALIRDTHDQRFGGRLE